MRSAVSAHLKLSLLPNSLTAIVADALRGAALAPTVGEALDVAGAALCSIAHIARADQPSARDHCANEPFCIARDAADQTMRVLDRVSYLLESISRLARDVDSAVEDLAHIARELVDAETDRIDCLFTRLAHQVITAEVQSTSESKGDALRIGDQIRSVHAGRAGTVVKVYADGSASVCWDDGEPQPEGLGHERMPRRLLEVQS
ncbi:hypothetical protein PQQ96_23980 [Paraburkholderia sediminicola]|uniref:hypothetical protein n=1 Tax=Paraburkholderia sediminicola TaxID=458836 RepID=UPI0038BDD79B